jgi:hypothetical protein
LAKFINVQGWLPFHINISIDSSYIVQESFHCRRQTLLCWTRHKLQRLDHIRVDGPCGVRNDVWHEISSRQIEPWSGGIAVHGWHDIWNRLGRLRKEALLVVSGASLNMFSGIRRVLDSGTELLDVVSRVIAPLFPDA